MKIALSACLFGCTCRYDGSHKLLPILHYLIARGHSFLLFCPEEFGGLNSPRDPFDLPSQDYDAILNRTHRIRTHAGDDITEQVVHGVMVTYELIRNFQPDIVLLKERSPSCGVHQTYMNGKLENQPGLLTWLLKKHGFECTCEEDLEPKLYVREVDDES